MKPFSRHAIALIALSSFTLSAGCLEENNAARDPKGQVNNDTSNNTPSNNDTSNNDTSNNDTSNNDTSNNDTSNNTSPDLMTQLVMAGFEVTADGVSESGVEQYTLVFQQPNDHMNPAAGTHPQTLSLLHRGFDLPMHTVVTGYDNYLGYAEMDITQALEINQVVLDKRFHNGQGSDWSLFTREQVNADYKEVITRLQTVYARPWFASGYSNGGMDIVFLEDAYPDLLDGNVVIATPFLAKRDERFLGVYEKVDQACQARLVEIQHAVLGERRAALEPMIEEIADTMLMNTYERVTFGAAYEAAVLSYPWLFWQYFGSEMDCAELPDPSAADDAMLAADLFEVISIFGLFPMSDDYLDYFGAYFYEVQSVTGWAAVPRLGLEEEGLIRQDLVDMEEGLVPEGVTAPTFDEAENARLREVAESSSHQIFIYAPADPWSTAAVTPDPSSGSVRYDSTDGNHQVDLTSLSEAEQEAILGTLRQWTQLAQ